MTTKIKDVICQFEIDRGLVFAGWGPGGGKHLVLCFHLPILSKMHQVPEMYLAAGTLHGLSYLMPTDMLLIS